MNPEFQDNQWHLFSYLELNEPSVLAMIFALSYSIATAFIIWLTKKRWMILSYAVLDGLAVALYYYSETPLWAKVFYFALYTFFLVASTTFIRDDKSKTIENVVSSMKDSGMSQKEIANETGKSESTISRIIKKIKGEN